ncbi:MAG TPA: prepilin-type N-terminal cleavage/methylation domain-containing protein [Armatimonadota bacterium]|nr:prepilin-type N-terminal cleavage/methylation domain-containing protein [Armatimonadota bacterium]
MKAFRKMHNKKGFTLIEIMIVVLIIGILLAVAVPSFLKARETSRAKSCISNLKQIESAKEQWAMDFRKTGTDTPAGTDLWGTGNYIKAEPICPSGGTYTIGSVATDPICSIGVNTADPSDDHVL